MEIHQNRKENDTEGILVILNLSIFQVSHRMDHSLSAPFPIMRTGVSGKLLIPAVELEMPTMTLEHRGHQRLPGLGQKDARPARWPQVANLSTEV